MTEKRLSDIEFRIMMDWFMESDPWVLDSEKHGILESHDIIHDLLVEESKKRGYDDWVVAFHEFEV